MTSNLSLRTALKTLSKQNIMCISHEDSLLLLDFMMKLYSAMLRKKKSPKRKTLCNKG